MNRFVAGRSRRRWMVLGFVAAVSAFTAGAAKSAGSPSPSPIPQGCQAVAAQPSAPTTLNSVSPGGIGKTIVNDLETFDCYNAQSTLAALKQVHTFIELVDRGRGGRHPASLAVARTVEEHVCTDNLVGGGVSCKTVNVPLGTTTTPIKGCAVVSGTYPFASIAQPAEPLELGTVRLAGGIVETVAVTKQVFDCQGDIGDLYLFAETSERVKGQGTPSSLGTKYEGVICKKDAATAAILACQLFTPTNG
jgi:hypothetical protein